MVSFDEESNPTGACWFMTQNKLVCACVNSAESNVELLRRFGIKFSYRLQD